MRSIFLRGDDGLVEMTETRYESEDVFQKLLTDHPRLLAGDQIDPASPRRWLLVRREAGVPGEEGGSDRWALDHLFLDQDAVPTLVEVKRSTDTRIRREVVGQMLDYAANAVVYWPADGMRTAFESRCHGEGRDADAELAAFLEPDASPDAFWETAAANLRAGRVRLLFVADVVPVELRRVVEFLNAQMSQTEVLAVEIKQYAGEGVTTLVPTVIGATAGAERGKPSARSASRETTREAFLAALDPNLPEAEVGAIRRVVEWSQREMPGTVFRETKNQFTMGAYFDADGLTYAPFALWTSKPGVPGKTSGSVEVKFEKLKDQPAFAPEAKRRDLLERLQTVEGINLSPSDLGLRPNRPFSVFAKPGNVDAFLAAMAWVKEEVSNGTISRTG